MDLFDKRFVHFLWDDEVEGKEGFFADDICELTNCVHSGNLHFTKVRKSLSPAFPFKDTNDNDWLFFYYDPNYEVKKAFNEGKKIQVLFGATWDDIDNEEQFERGLEIKYIFRIKPAEEKWIAYLARETNGSCYLSACTESCWKAVQRELGAKTKLFVGTESEVSEWFESRQKLAKVIKAWEDGKTIQFLNPVDNNWVMIIRPSWETDLKYRVKPEEKKWRPRCIYEEGECVKITKLESQIEKMKCCANCENYCQRIDNRCNTECRNHSLWKLNKDFGWRTESN